MTDQAGTQSPGNQAPPANAAPKSASPKSASPKSKAGSLITKIAYQIVAIIFVVLSLIRVYNFFFPSLPDCDGSIARDTLSDIFKRDNLQPASYDDMKTVTKSKDELSCSARLKMSDGSLMDIAYRIYWQGKDPYVEVTGKTFNRDQK
jgi:hypothetical protein